MVRPKQYSIFLWVLIMLCHERDHLRDASMYRSEASQEDVSAAGSDPLRNSKQANMTSQQSWEEVLEQFVGVVGGDTNAYDDNVKSEAAQVSAQFPFMTDKTRDDFVLYQNT